MTQATGHLLPRRYTSFMALFVSALLAFSTGCTAQSRVAGPASVQGLQGTETKYGTLRLTASNGSPVHLRPGDTLTVNMGSQNFTADAELFCRDASGLSLREAHEDCTQAVRIGTWDEIGSIEVEQFDGGSTVTAVTVGAAAVALIAVAVAATSKSNGPKGGSGDTKAPVVVGRHAHVHHGYIAPRYPVSSSILVFGMGPNGDGSRSDAAPDDAEVQRPAPGPASGWQVATGGALPPEAAAAPAPPRDATPLFSGWATRRASFRPSLRVDSSACAFSEACLTGSARVGFTLFDLLELSGGARWEHAKTDTVLGTVGAGLSGTFPRLPALSVFFGSQFAFGDGYRIIPSAGVRVSPFGGLSIGILPASFTYMSPSRGSRERERFAFTPSIEVGYEF